MKKLVVLVLTILLFQSCNTDTEDELLFSASVFHEGFWVMVSNDNGKVLDYKEVTDPEEILEFYGSTKSSTISVTVIDARQESAGSLTTYQHVQVGTSWLDRTSFPPIVGTPESIGTFDLTINNYNDGDTPFLSFAISDGYNFLYSYLDDVYYEGNSYHAKVHLREGVSGLLVTTYYENNPMYYRIEEVSVDDKVVIDFADFSPMQTVHIQTEHEQTFGYMRGVYGSDDQLHDIQSNYDLWNNSLSSNTGQFNQFGYLDGYDYYEYSVSYAEFDESYNYWNVFNFSSPSVPEQIVAPSVNVEIIDPSIGGFTATIDQDYTYQWSLFRYNTGDGSRLSWMIFNPENTSIQVPEFPSKLISELPVLGNRGNLKFFQTQFRHLKHDTDYQDILRWFVNAEGAQSVEESESYWVTNRE